MESQKLKLKDLVAESVSLSRRASQQGTSGTSDETEPKDCAPSPRPACPSSQHPGIFRTSEAGRPLGPVESIGIVRRTTWVYDVPLSDEKVKDLVHSLISSLSFEDSRENGAASDEINLTFLGTGNTCSERPDLPQRQSDSPQVRSVEVVRTWTFCMKKVLNDKLESLVENLVRVVQDSTECTASDEMIIQPNGHGFGFHDQRHSLNAARCHAVPSKGTHPSTSEENGDRNRTTANLVHEVLEALPTASHDHAQPQETDLEVAQSGKSITSDFRDCSNKLLECGGCSNSAAEAQLQLQEVQANHGASDLPTSSSSEHGTPLAAAKEAEVIGHSNSDGGTSGACSPNGAAENQTEDVLAVSDSEAEILDEVLSPVGPSADCKVPRKCGAFVLPYSCTVKSTDGPRRLRFSKAKKRRLHSGRVETIHEVRGSAVAETGINLASDGDAMGLRGYADGLPSLDPTCTINNNRPWTRARVRKDYLERKRLASTKDLIEPAIPDDVSGIPASEELSREPAEKVIKTRKSTSRVKEIIRAYETSAAVEGNARKDLNPLRPPPAEKITTETSAKFSSSKNSRRGEFEATILDRNGGRSDHVRNVTAGEHNHLLAGTRKPRASPQQGNFKLHKRKLHSILKTGRNSPSLRGFIQEVQKDLTVPECGHLSPGSAHLKKPTHDQGTCSTTKTKINTQPMIVTSSVGTDDGKEKGPQLYGDDRTAFKPGNDCAKTPASCLKGTYRSGFMDGVEFEGPTFDFAVNDFPLFSVPSKKKKRVRFFLPDELERATEEEFEEEVTRSATTADVEVLKLTEDGHQEIQEAVDTCTELTEEGLRDKPEDMQMLRSSSRRKETKDNSSGSGTCLPQHRHGLPDSKLKARLLRESGNQERISDEEKWRMLILQHDRAWKKIGRILDRPPQVRHEKWRSLKPAPACQTGKAGKLGKDRRYHKSQKQGLRSRVVYKKKCRYLSSQEVTSTPDKA